MDLYFGLILTQRLTVSKCIEGYLESTASESNCWVLLNLGGDNLEARC